MTEVDRHLAPFDTDHALRQFASANVIAGNISDQNDRAEMLAREVTDTDFLTLGNWALALEQRDTLCNLEAASSSAPYAEVGLRYIQALNALGQRTLQLADLESEKAFKEAEVAQQADVLTRIVPTFANETSELLERKKASIAQEIDTVEIRQDIDVLKQDISTYEALITAAGSWSIPRIQFEQPAFDKVSPGETADMDTEILEVQLREQPHEGVRIGESHKDAPEAAKQVLEYLLTHVNEVIEVDHLINHVYDPQVIESNTTGHLRARITTQLGPKIHGPIIEAILAEEGYTLQYGRMTVRHGENGDAPKSGVHRVYRIIPLNEFCEAHTQPAENIRWEITKDQKELLENTQLSGELVESETVVTFTGGTSQRLLTILTDNLDKPHTYPELAALLYPDSDKDQPTLINRVQVLLTSSKYIQAQFKQQSLEIVKQTVPTAEPGGRKRVAIVCQKKSEEIAQPPSDITAQPVNTSNGARKTKNAVKLSPTTNSRLSAERTTKEKAAVHEALKWEQPFRQRVRESIRRFEQAGLMPSSEQIDSAHIPIAHREVLDYLYSKGIITDEQFRSKRVDIRGAIAALLLRVSGTKQLLHSTAKRRVAVGILDEELARHAEASVRVA